MPIKKDGTLYEEQLNLVEYKFFSKASRAKTDGVLRNTTSRK